MDKTTQKKILPAMTIEVGRQSKLTSAQIKYLRDRIQSIYYSSHDVPKPKDPRDVRLARQLVRRWDAKHQRTDHRHRVAWKRAQRRAQDAILFETPLQALLAVRAFEKIAGRSL